MKCAACDIKMADAEQLANHLLNFGQSSGVAINGKTTRGAKRMNTKQAATWAIPIAFFSVIVLVGIMTLAVVEHAHERNSGREIIQNWFDDNHAQPESIEIIETVNGSLRPFRKGWSDAAIYHRHAAEEYRHQPYIWVKYREFPPPWRRMSQTYFILDQDGQIVEILNGRRIGSFDNPFEDPPQ